MDAGGLADAERGGRGGVRGVMQLLLLDTPLAPDKPLWTSQAAYNKQAGCCRHSLSGRAQGRPQVDFCKKKKKNILMEYSASFRTS